MAFVPHLDSDYQFSPEEFSNMTSVIAQGNYGSTSISTSTPTIPCGAISSSGAMLGHEQDLPSLYDNNAGLECFPVESDISCQVPMTTATFTGQLDVSEVVEPSFMDYRMGFDGNAKLIQNFEGGLQYSNPCEYGDYCCEFVHYCKSICPDSGENLRIQCNQMPATKIGRYTVEERKDRILRYLKKRNQRNFNKTIKYACRKTLADQRVRVRGRFARKNEVCENKNGGKMSENPLQEKESYSNGAVEMNNEDDDWLQESVAGLMHVPSLAR